MSVVTDCKNSLSFDPFIVKVLYENAGLDGKKQLTLKSLLNSLLLLRERSSEMRKATVSPSSLLLEICHLICEIGRLIF